MNWSSIGDHPRLFGEVGKKTLSILAKLAKIIGISADGSASDTAIFDELTAAKFAIRKLRLNAIHRRLRTGAKKQGRKEEI